MTLIKSISGIRGTIGGASGDNLTPFDIVKFTTAYSKWLKTQSSKDKYKVVVGRDARISGPDVRNIVVGTLTFCGVDVVDIGLATTPTTEIAVTEYEADGGIILTASHNPAQWNALKLLNKNGEFLTAEDGKFIIENSVNAEQETIFTDVMQLGKVQEVSKFEDVHINKVLALPLVDVEAIRKANFTVCVDTINSVGGIIVPKLLKALGVNNFTTINAVADGNFAHNPEPLKQNLVSLSEAVKKSKADVGFAVDPDVDRLAIMQEDGEMFGEEYTLVAVADYILQHHKGNTVSNLSSSRALRDVTVQAGGSYEAAAVGELNVVTKMKATNAIIGGEGNGGVIYPELHYGRDSIVGIALFLTYLAKCGKKVSELKATYPQYYMSKNKIQLTPEINVDAILAKVNEIYSSQPGVTVTTIDGVKIDFPENWVHLRKSNTEPIIRIYTEAKSQQLADTLAEEMISKIEHIIK
ncbi:MAG: phosphoglucosamine mutase [Bacteroidales bacterium]|nr:phosphoglucosamine mutase [Bacteroidales bacterium]